MRELALALLVGFAATSSVQAQVHVDGHVRRDGTYVPPHYRTAPDDTRMNNWSTRGNTNPYTGQPGYRDPYAPTQPSPGVLGTQQNLYGGQRRY